MIDPQIFAFIGLAAMLTITPGADTMLVMRNTLMQGRRAGILTVLGGCAGILIHATLSGLGLSFVLVQSAALYELIKLAGAAYLIWLGLQSLWRASHVCLESRPSRSTQQPSRALWDRLLSNLLNPKTALFYLALLPQFVQTGSHPLTTSLLLAAIHLAMRFVWLYGITALIQQTRALFNRSAVKRSLEAITGAALCTFGFRLALARRD